MSFEQEPLSDFICRGATSIKTAGILDAIRGAMRNRAAGRIVEEGVNIAPSRLHHLMYGGGAFEDIKDVQNLYRSGLTERAGKMLQELGDIKNVDEVPEHLRDLHRGVQKQIRRGVRESGDGGGSRLPSILGGTALGGALMLPAAGVVGHEFGRSGAEEDSKRKAMTAFGGGLAAGVAAPKLVRSAQGLLSNVQQGMGGGMGQSPSPMGMPSFYGVKQGSVLEKEAILRRAADWISGLAGSGRSMRKAISASDEAAQAAAQTGKQISQGAKGSTTAPTAFQGMKKNAPPMKSVKQAPAEQAAAPVQQAAAPAQQAAAPVEQAAAPQRSIRERVEDWMSPEARAGMQNMANATGVKAFQKNPLLMPMAGAAGLGVGGAGIAGGSYLAGQHQAENRPFLERSFGIKL